MDDVGRVWGMSIMLSFRGYTIRAINLLGGHEGKEV